MPDFWSEAMAAGLSKWTFYWWYYWSPAVCAILLGVALACKPNRAVTLRTDEERAKHRQVAVGLFLILAVVSLFIRLSPEAIFFLLGLKAHGLQSLTLSGRKSLWIIFDLLAITVTLGTILSLTSSTREAKESLIQLLGFHPSSRKETEPTSRRERVPPEVSPETASPSSKIQPSSPSPSKQLDTSPPLPDELYLQVIVGGASDEEISISPLPYVIGKSTPLGERFEICDAEVLIDRDIGGGYQLTKTAGGGRVELRRKRGKKLETLETKKRVPLFDGDIIRMGEKAHFWFIVEQSKPIEEGGRNAA